MCWQSPPKTVPPVASPPPSYKFTPPMVLKLLDNVAMATHRGIDMIKPNEGSYGFIVKILGQSGSKIAVKIFKHVIDSELAFLGVDYDTETLKHVLNMPRRNKYQNILYESGFVPTVLRKADATCPVCKCITLQHQHTCSDKESIGYCATLWLSREVHYHVYMPLMDGNVCDLLHKTYFSLEQRMKIFLDVAAVIQKLSHHDVINPDLKAPNILYRKTNTKYIYAPCDVGGVYVAGQSRVDVEMDRHTRYLVTNVATNARRLVGKAHDEDTTKYRPPQPDEVSRKVHWTVATYVDIFLNVRGVKSNYDLSDSTHLTNQFTLLSFFMYMVYITPPSHEMATTREVYMSTRELYPSVDKYLEDNMGGKLLIHPLHTQIVEFVKDSWKKSSNWELLGTKHTYVKNIMNQVKGLLNLTKHSPPPRKVLRHSVLDEE